MKIGDDIEFTPMSCFACVLIGLWGGCIIGFITEYFTSSYTPVRVWKSLRRELPPTSSTVSRSDTSRHPAVLIISVIIYVGFSSAGMYGVSLSALGMLSTLATCLSIDVLGRVTTQAVSLRCVSFERVRNKTDALDAAGNTTAAIGKDLPSDRPLLCRLPCLALSSPACSLFTSQSLGMSVGRGRSTLEASCLRLPPVWCHGPYWLDGIDHALGWGPSQWSKRWPDGWRLRVSRILLGLTSMPAEGKTA